MRPSHWKLTLNIDVSATAFYKAQPVTDFMCELLDLRNTLHTLTLNDNQRSRLSKELRNLKIEITHAEHARKYRVCNLTRRSAQEQVFPLQLESGQTVECTLAKIFQEKYRIQACPASRWARSTSTHICPWRSVGTSLVNVASRS